MFSPKPLDLKPYKHNKINNVSLVPDFSFAYHTLREMASKAFLLLASISTVYTLELRDNNYFHSEKEGNISATESDPDKVFDNVYTECFSRLSFVCLQKKTLLYLKEINRLNEISVIGEYVKFGKILVIFSIYLIF